jgi:hypothetical protein
MEVNEELGVRVAVAEPPGEREGEGGLADAAHALQTDAGDGAASGASGGQQLFEFG